MRIWVSFFVCAVSACASADVVNRAGALYQHTDYESSLRILAQDKAPDSHNYLLSGKNYFMLGDYKQAINFFEKALDEAPRSSEAELWLGRCVGTSCRDQRHVTDGDGLCVPHPAMF